MSCDHRPVRLASSGTIVIERCGCGVVHLSVGHLTLHLNDRAFFEVASQVGLAAEALAARRALSGAGPHLSLVSGEEQ